MMRAALTLLLAASCGLGGAEGGGSDHLPTSGLGPYGRVQDDGSGTPANEPVAVNEPGADLGDPSAVLRPGGGFRIWFTYDARDGATDIRASDLLSWHELPLGPPALALAASEPWEEGSVAAPSVVFTGDEYQLYYQGGSSIGLATSADAVTWQKQGVVLEDAADPSALLVAGDTLLYFTRPGETAIRVATLDGTLASEHPDPVLDGRATTLGAFDRAAVGQPAAAGGVTAAGQIRVYLFYTGTAVDGATAIGVAASADGFAFERLDEPTLTAATAPHALLTPFVGVLFYTASQPSGLAIAVATSP